MGECAASCFCQITAHCKQLAFELFGKRVALWRPPACGFFSWQKSKQWQAPCQTGAGPQIYRHRRFGCYRATKEIATMQVVNVPPRFCQNILYCNHTTITPVCCCSYANTIKNFCVNFYNAKSVLPSAFLALHLTVVQYQKRNCHHNEHGADNDQIPKFAFVILFGFVIVVERAIFHLGQIAPESVYQPYKSITQHAECTTVVHANKQAHAQRNSAGHEKGIAQITIYRRQSCLRECSFCPQNQNGYHGARGCCYWILYQFLLHFFHFYKKRL